MTLRKLGLSIKDQIAAADRTISDSADLLKEAKRLNRYMALMTNEPDPPTEESLTDPPT